MAFGGCLGSFFFWVAVHSGKFLSADRLALPDFVILISSSSSARITLSQDKTLTAWFGNVFAGQIPHRFSESDCEILYTSSMSPYEDVTQRCFCFFWMIFRKLSLFGKCGPPQTQYIRRKKPKKRTPPGYQASGWTHRARARFQGLFLENGVDVWTFVRKIKCVLCVNACNYLASGWDQLWAIYIWL